MPPTDFDTNNPHAQHTLRTLAEEAARTGGQIARQNFGHECDVRLKDDRSEVSQADEITQAAIVRTIQAHRPHDSFVVEESVEAAEPSPPPTNDRLCWLIDPIDGTRNYIRQVPLYSCSVAAMIDGTPLVGAVYDPVRDTMYSASRVGGLFIDGEHRSPKAVAEGRPAGCSPKPMVALPSTSRGVITEIAHQWLERFVTRCLGSTALHLALVATGALDGMIADNARLWDIAAGWVLITAGGGKITSPNRAPLFPLDVAKYNGEELPTIAGTAAAYERLVSST